MGYDKDEVKEALTTADIFNLLEYFGANPRWSGDNIIATTVCHGGDSSKLYYFENNKIFDCFTNCGTMDVFELIKKVKGIEDFNECVQWVVEWANLGWKLTEKGGEKYTEDWKVFQHNENLHVDERSEEKILLPQYDNPLKYFPKARPKTWLDEGIKPEILDYANIKLDPVEWSIVIPHYDQDSRLVGIRQRTMIKDKERFGKYRPWFHDGKLYNHPLSFNFYGFSDTYKRIQEIQTAVIVESEKSVLKSLGWFGTKNNMVVACCGSSLSNYQYKMLNDLGVKEIIVAFDMDFKEKHTEEYEKCKQKIAKVANKFSQYCRVSVLFDEQGVLGYKQSPFDRDLDTFMYLFRNRYTL